MTQKGSNILACLALVVGVAALCVSIVTMGMIRKGPGGEVPPAPAPAEDPEGPAAPSDPDIQYVLYIGTNDKDSNDPVYDPDEALEHTDAVLTNYFSGFTIQEARGGWVNDDGSVAHEYTIVVYLSDTDLDTVHAACDDLIAEFNQSAILIQQNHTTTEFYSN